VAVANKKLERISSLILEYLRKNPEAGDTLEGIAKWWLEIERIEVSVNEIADALKSLIKKEQILVYKTRGGTTFYKFSDGKF
jgi:hypothetical protein